MATTVGDSLAWHRRSIDFFRFAGLAAAVKIAKETENAVVVQIVCDRGDRYLSTGVFPA